MPRNIVLRWPGAVEKARLDGPVELRLISPEEEPDLAGCIMITADGIVGSIITPDTEIEFP